MNDEGLIGYDLYLCVLQRYLIVIAALGAAISLSNKAKRGTKTAIFIMR